MMTRAMKGATAESWEDIWLPCAATPKLDGIRAVKVGGQLLSPAWKPLPNLHLQRLAAELPDGLDGELVCGDFNATQSAVMRIHGEPAVTWHVFDKWHPTAGYWDRAYSLLDMELPEWCRPHLPTALLTPEELQAFEAAAHDAGYEGIVARDAYALYYSGRAKLPVFAKLKRFHDSEIRVTGFKEGRTNLNADVRNNHGYASRPGTGLLHVPRGTLGGVYGIDVNYHCEVHVGSGFTDAQRDEIWSNQHLYVGRILRYRYQKAGSKDAPRFPRFVAWLHPGL